MQKFQYINFFLFVLFVFALPFKDNFLPTILSAWILSWLLEGSIKQKFLNFNYLNKYYLPFALYFLLSVLESVQANNAMDAWYSIQDKLSLAFFPIIIAGSNNLIKKNYRKILIIFVIANITVSLYLLANTFFAHLIVENGNWHFEQAAYKGLENKYSFFQLIGMRMNVFSGRWLAYFVHPSYLSMFHLFSIIILIYFLRNKLIKKTTYKLLSGLGIAFLLIIIYLLQSRAGFIALIISIIAIFLLEVFRKKQKRYFFAGIILFIIALSALLYSPRMQKIIKQTSQIVKEKDNIELKKLDDRFQTNFSALQIIKDNFWTGVGPANMYDELKKQYSKYGFSDAFKERLNAHNQYLETFAGLGIFGFLTLLAIFILGFLFAFKNKHYLLFFLLLILSVNFLFESMLNRVHGILFMMLFYSLFVFLKQDHFEQE